MTAGELHPALDRIIRRARETRERRGGKGNASVRLGVLGLDEARELDALLAASGWRRRILSGEPVSVPLTRIEAALEATGHDPAAVYAALEPEVPVRDRPAERRARLRRRDELWTWIAGHPALAARPRVGAWVETARTRGLIGPDDRDDLAAALNLLSLLPLDAPCERGVIAARKFGDAHALDEGERLNYLMCALLRADAVLPSDCSDRAAWASAGVLSDTTSSTVLTLGLAPSGEGALASALRALEGRHAVVTLGQLETEQLIWPVSGTCHTCENPSVLRAAERSLGAACPPLVCTEGWPSDAARMLLRSLRGANWLVRHHGDFDLGGTGIMRHLADSVGAVGWRFDAISYERALTELGDVDLPRLRPSGAVASDALEAALSARRRVVCEELVLDDLLADLEAESVLLRGR